MITEADTTRVLADALSVAGVALGSIADQSCEPGISRIAHQALDEMNDMMVHHLLKVVVASKIDPES